MAFKEILREGEAAEYVGVSLSTLRNARLYGSLRTPTIPPPHIKIGRSIRYRLMDLDNWLEQSRVTVAH